ncbi:MULTISPECIES: tryptophan dimethylallyltransferase family protein [Actinoalloteichus]|uniref:tryptophan dimethylallyltransferase family protein n=1 Tax=Actinoalloteichus TaxID=65496 RepID=UPI0018DC027A|nr:MULTISPECIES: tryptophan dimethylallyltransferase family protein [Actinoalloteichus]
MTYRDVVTAHLQLLAETIDPTIEAAASQAAVAGSLLGEWADEPVERFDDHHSFASNDGSPVEFSLAMTRSAAEARALFEPLNSASDPSSPRREGRRFVERLDEALNVDVHRFRLIADLFDETSGTYSMLGSAALKTGGTPLFKVYLNPAARGLRPQQVVGEAMGRLGLSTQWEFLSERLGRDGFDRPQQEIALFALDLGDSPDARVKLYLRHSDCGPDEIERAASLARDYQPDAFTKILGRFYDDPVEHAAKAPITCLAYQGGGPEPASATLYCPLDPNLDDDAEARTRVVDVLTMSGIAPDLFDDVVSAISGTDPSSGHRLSWMSCKRPADPVVTVYAGLGGTPR